MRLRKFLPLAFLLFLVFTSGCETAKGFTRDVKNIRKNTWSHLQSADDWVKKNLW